MRRFLTLVVLLCLAVPAGISISGCTRNPAGAYCNGLGYGQKISAINAIALSPATIGISLAYGQTKQVASPLATDCKGAYATAVGGFTYGTTNNQLVDVSPNGDLCAGTWNRNSSGGIPNYTICTPPNPLPTDPNGAPYGSVLITASTSGVTSNPVTVSVHPQVTALSLVGPPACLSQGQTSQLDGEACYAIDGVQYELCAPASVSHYACPGGLASGVSSVPTCSVAVGNLSYASTNSSVAKIDQFGVVTAGQPGTTAVTSTLSNSSSSAGFFSTCPPKSIALTLNGNTSATVTQGVPQNLTTTITDTNDNQIVGLALNYQSTNPTTITASSTGGITPSFPGQAAIYATCEPITCNPAPINQIGVQGTGLPVSSNPVNITVPGKASTYAWFGSPNQSQYFSEVELITGAIGSSVRLPYMPNSMVMDAQAQSIYFGSTHELMIYSASGNTLQKTDTSVPGIVLAVSPNSSLVVINDQVRNLFYLYSPVSGIATTFSGLGVAAAFTPDSQTVYIVDQASAGVGHTDTLYVYNLSSSWSPPQTITGGAQNLAVTVPGIGAYLAGPQTVANAWCPSGPVGDFTQDLFYPPADTVLDTGNNPVPTDALAATNDGEHIIGAALTSPTTATLSDIGVTIPLGECPSVTDGDIVVGDTMPALSIPNTLAQGTIPLSTNAQSINQIVTSKATVGSTAQDLAFVTYLPSTSNPQTGATLPYYVTSASGPATFGTLGSVNLTGASSITAPVAGIFSPDNTLFFVSTAGDNLIHYINVDTLTDTQSISPGLTACTPGTDGCALTTAPPSGTVPATVLAVKPRLTT